MHLKRCSWCGAAPGAPNIRIIGKKWCPIHLLVPRENYYNVLLTLTRTIIVIQMAAVCLCVWKAQLLWSFWLRKPPPSTCYRTLLEIPFQMKALVSLSALTSSHVSEWLPRKYFRDENWRGRRKAKRDGSWGGEPTCQRREGHPMDGVGT